MKTPFPVFHSRKLLYFHRVNMNRAKNISFIAVMLFGAYFSSTAQTSGTKIPVKELKTITLLHALQRE